jgi:hypothetical protein
MPAQDQINKLHAVLEDRTVNMKRYLCSAVSLLYQMTMLERFSPRVDKFYITLEDEYCEDPLQATFKDSRDQVVRMFFIWTSK